MTYYINPWVFYLVGIAGVLSEAARVVSVSCAMIVAVLLIFVFIYDSTGDDSEFAGTLKRLLKKTVKVLFVSLILLVLAPSKETCYQMLIASQVTVENVNGVKETVKEVADYIVEASEKISGGNEHDG